MAAAVDATALSQGSAPPTTSAPAPLVARVAPAAGSSDATTPAATTATASAATAATTKSGQPVAREPEKERSEDLGRQHHEVGGANRTPSVVRRDGPRATALLEAPLLLEHLCVPSRARALRALRALRAPSPSPSPSPSLHQVLEHFEEQGERIAHAARLTGLRARRARSVNVRH